MDRKLTARTAEMIGQRLRREFYAEPMSGGIWQSLVRLCHAETERRRLIAYRPHPRSPRCGPRRP